MGAMGVLTKRRTILVATCITAVVVAYLNLTSISKHLAADLIGQMPFLPKDVRAKLWDRLHESNSTKTGGVWEYSEKKHNQRLFKYMRSKNPKMVGSVLDVACNLGYLLARLEHILPTASLYGSDISRVMVEATKDKCKNCTTTQFDLSTLANGAHNFSASLHRESFDFVIVGDVLFYVEFCHISVSAAYHMSLPRSFCSTQKQMFWLQLRRLARREVVISSHMRNPGITILLQEAGAERNETYTVWTLSGAAQDV